MEVLLILAVVVRVVVGVGFTTWQLARQDAGKFAWVEDAATDLSELEKSLIILPSKASEFIEWFTRGAANLGLLMRKMFGCGTPRALPGRLRALATATDRGKTLVRAILGLCAASFRLSGRLIAFSSPTPAPYARV